MKEITVVIISHDPSDISSPTQIPAKDEQPLEDLREVIEIIQIN